MFEPWVWHLGGIKDLLSDRHGFKRMGRTENRIYNMARSVLREKRWTKMKAEVNIGVSNPKDPEIRVVKVKRLRNACAIASDYLYVDKNYVERITPKRLKHTIRHELVHYYLSDNRVRDSSDHGKLFKQCCAILGLKDPHSWEADWKYKHICPGCGRWVKSMKRLRQIHCTCGKTLVDGAEYKRLKQMSQIASRLRPVNIDYYLVMKVVKP